jgi:hypothetical protein
MLRHELLAILAGLMAFALAAPAAAWKGELEGGVRPISEVVEKAERFDHVIVEGEVTRVTTGHGNRVVVFFEDATGEIPLAVPNHLLRHFAGGSATGGSGPGGVSPQVGRRARVMGQWDHASLDDGTWGIRVQKVEPLDD